MWPYLIGGFIVGVFCGYVSGWLKAIQLKDNVQVSLFSKGCNQKLPNDISKDK